MTKRQLNDKEILQDTRSGMDDTALMEKHNLSPQELQNALSKLVAIGVVKQSEMDGRTFSHERTVNEVWKCPACGKEQQRGFDECPICGVIVHKYNSKAELTTEIHAEPLVRGKTRVLVGAVCLLLMGGLGAGWYYNARILEERRLEAERLQQQKIEEQVWLQAKANERAEEIRNQNEAQRLEDELQRQQDRDLEAWRKQEEGRIQAEETKQNKQESQQTAKEERAKRRVTRAYLNMMRLTRDMSIILLGENVSSAIPSLKARAGAFQDGLSELKRTPGADPTVVNHFDKAFHHLMTAFKGRSGREKYDSLRMWKEECRSAFAQIKASR